MYALRIIIKHSRNLKFTLFFLILSSFLSSTFNAMSVVSLIPIVSLILDSKIDDKITNLLNQFVDYDFNQLNQSDYIIIFIFLFIIAGLLKILNDFFIIKIRVKIISFYLKEILNCFFSSNWHFFYMNDIGKISNSIYKELEKVSGSIMATLQLISNIFLISVIIWIPFFISYKVTFFSLLSIILLLLPIKIINFYFYKIGKKITLESSFFSSVFFYGSTLYKNITANAGNERIIREIYHSYKKINLYEILKKVLNSSISEFLKVFGILFVFIIFGISVKFGLGIPESAAILYAFIRIFPHINNTIEMRNALENLKPGFELIEDLKIKSQNLTDYWGDENFREIKQNIKFDNVSYSYPSGKIAISNINFEIKKGEMIALVGKSGSGKSTILDLISGLNTSSSGKVLIDNKEPHHYDKKSFLKQVGYVDSNINLFPYSLEDNIKIFNPDATDQDLNDACLFANIEEKLKNLRNDSNVIEAYQGSAFSSGQKQRICIARAMIKKPSIIIFDEATNYLDDANEISILENLKKLKEKKTIIFATHKKSILKYFDKVFYIEEGQLNKIK